MAKKIISKNTKKDSAKPPGAITKKRRDKKGVVYKGHRKSAVDGFSMEIPPKKPIITKPKNEDEKKD